MFIDKDTEPDEVFKEFSEVRWTIERVTGLYNLLMYCKQNNKAFKLYTDERGGPCATLLKDIEHEQ